MSERISNICFEATDGDFLGEVPHFADEFSVTRQSLEISGVKNKFILLISVECKMIEWTKQVSFNVLCHGNEVRSATGFLCDVVNIAVYS